MRKSKKWIEKRQAHEDKAVGEYNEEKKKKKTNEITMQIATERREGETTRQADYLDENHNNLSW